MARDDEHLEPTVASATRAGWRTWARDVATSGWRWVAGLGLALGLGFSAAILALYGFAKLADDVIERDVDRLDGAVLGWLRQFSSPPLDAAAGAISFLGSEGIAVLLVLLLVVFGRQRRWGAIGALLVTTVGAQLLNNVLKDIFQRTRPAPVLGVIPAQAFSFPSGHAMVSMAFYCFLAYVSWRVLRGWQRAAWAAGLLLLVLLIGLSRLYLGVHYLTDVAAGYLAGFIWADAVIIGGALLTRRRRVAGSSAEHPRRRGRPVQSGSI